MEKPNVLGEGMGPLPPAEKENNEQVFGNNL